MCCSPRTSSNSSPDLRPLHDLQRSPYQRRAQIYGFLEARVFRRLFRHRQPPAVFLCGDVHRSHGQDLAASRAARVHLQRVARFHAYSGARLVTDRPLVLQRSPLLALTLTADDLPLALRLALEDRGPPVRVSLRLAGSHPGHTIRLFPASSVAFRASSQDAKWTVI